jgi:hypothetical protein
MGATKERRGHIKQERHEKWLQSYCIENKFLRDEKYYKNNYWSMAAYDSWAAQGKAGSCPCGCGHYNGTLCNTRASAKSGGRENHCKDVSRNLCYDCIKKIEKILNHTFRQRH